MSLTGIGVLVALLGIIGVVYGVMMRMRAGRVTDAPFVKTGEIPAKGSSVANPKGAISAEGNISCQQPLTAPVSGKTCLFYEITVTAEWKDGETTKTKEIAKEKRCAQFAIDDGSGPVWVDAREGGDFEPRDTMSQTKSTSLLGGITGQDLMFGQYRVSTGMLSLGTKYLVSETILPAVQRAYVCGKLGSSNEITAPGWRKLLITHKTREDYLGHAMKSAKIALIAAASLFGVGTILGIVGVVTGDPGAAKKPTAAATAAATQQPAGTDTAATTGNAASDKTPAPTRPAAAPVRAPAPPPAHPAKRR